MTSEYIDIYKDNYVKIKNDSNDYTVLDKSVFIYYKDLNNKRHRMSLKRFIKRHLQTQNMLNKSTKIGMDMAIELIDLRNKVK
jgi:hypothetical protein